MTMPDHTVSLPWRAAALAVACLAPALAACDASHVAATAQVRITGRALDASGNPLRGVAVRLLKEADLGEVTFGMVFALGTLGTACLVPEAPVICARMPVATTDGDGSYSFTLSGSDTQGSIGQASTLDVVVAEPGRGGDAASTTLQFEAQTTHVSLPDARLWDAGLTTGAGTGQVRLRWRSLPAEDGRDVSESVDVADVAHRAAIWTQTASGTDATIDPRVLEDVASTAVVVASTKIAVGTADVTAAYTSRRVGLAGGSGAPPSRGRPCGAVDASLSTTAQPRCGVTDGDLSSPSRLEGAPGHVVSGALVDLGVARARSLVVVRGAAAGVLLEVSTDGRTFTPVGTVQGPIAALPLAGGPVRAVRVRSSTGLDESLMAEVSVW